MGSDAKSTPFEKLLANVLETRFENFGRETLENTRNRMIDVIGCAIGGVNAPGNSALIDLIKDWGGKEEATILIHGKKVPAQNAAMVNSIMARSFDFEAMSPLIDGINVPSHIAATTVMTAVAMGEANRINGKEFTTALLVGDDLASRVLAASEPGFTLGWDSIGTVNALGATAIAGRLLSLSQSEMRNAFGLVLNQLAGSFQSIWDGTTAFKLYQGMSARNGIFSAELAKAGWTGPQDALLSKFGYFHLYTEGCTHPEILTKELGKKYYADSTFKPYPCCRATHPAIDCALAIVQKQQVKADDIEEIILYLPRRGLDNFMGQPFRIGNFPQADAIFNYRYNVANALVRRSVKPEHFLEEFIRDSEVNALVQRVRLAELPGTEKLKCKIELKMKDGREFSEATDAPKGDPISNPMSKKEIIAKFWANVDFSKTVTRKNAEELLDLLEKLEELDNINKVVRLLMV
jgi:2-methylcitrate dehydratase PrpD